jgi:hypothetical protein
MPNRITEWPTQGTELKLTLELKTLEKLLLAKAFASGRNSGIFNTFYYSYSLSAAFYQISLERSMKKLSILLAV